MIKYQNISPLLELIIFFTFLMYTSPYKQCPRSTSTPTIPKYHLIEKCHKSKLSIAARGHFTSLTSCKRLATQKNALAFNFSPKANSSDPIEYTCDVLKCAEAEGGFSLIKDMRYDYYSIYAKPLPNINSTCVPTTGMFLILTEKLTYTQATAQCSNISAVLADITSEQRTDALAQALLSANVDQAYVGMMRTNYSKFTINNGTNSLDCLTYRAWAPGHPQRNYNMSCVILTKYRTWKTVRCQDTYQALCELNPKGPYKKGSIFHTKNHNATATGQHNIEDLRNSSTSPDNNFTSLA